MWHSVGNNRFVKKAVSIRTITLTLGILVALFILLTLVSRSFPITLSEGAAPALQILSGFQNVGKEVGSGFSLSFFDIEIILIQVKNH